MASVNLNLNYKQDIWDVKCSVSEISSSGNDRTVSLKLEVRTKDFTGGRDGGYHVNCTEGGDIGESACTVPGSSQDRLVLYDETFDVYVAPGETYADISFDFEIHFYSSSAGANRSLSGTIDCISGLSIVSDVSISSAKDIYFGDKVSITWTPSASEFAYKLKFVLGSYTYTTGVLSPNRTTAYTYNGLTVPISAASNIPNSVSGSMAVTITQYKSSNSTETVGSSVTKNFKVTLKDNIIPTISTYSASLDNSNNASVAAWGIGLVGYSKIKLSASASGIYGSTIKSFTISGDYTATVSGSSLNYTGGTLSSSGNKSFNIICTDSRGRKSSAVTTDIISILPYTPPKLVSLSTAKEEYGDANILNDRMVVTANWEYDTINGHNSASGIAYYKESFASEWFPHSGIVNNNTPFILSELQLDDVKSYNIKVVVTDSVGNSSDKSSFSSTTQVLLDFRAGGKGLGIGKICENDGMEVSMDATFYNNVYVQRDSEKYDLESYVKMLSNAVLNEQRSNLLKDIYPIGSIYISVSSTSPQILFGGTWTKLKDRFLLGDGDTYKSSQTGGSATHTLTIEEMPKHAHWGAARPSYDVKGGTHPSAVMDDNKINYIETNSAGSGAAHNNMPPYLVVYMWKRTA
jgi:hypothetical protein